MLSVCSTPSQIRAAINRDRYYISNKCLIEIKDKISELIENSNNPKYTDLYTEILEEVDMRTESVVRKQETIRNTPKAKKKEKKINYVDIGNDGINLETDLESGVMEAVQRHVFLTAYNRFNGSTSLISKYLGMSQRSISIWKRKYKVKDKNLH